MLALKVFLDANVFLYSVGTDHPQRLPCRRVLERVADGSLAAATSVEVLQEIVSVLSRRGRLSEGIVLTKSVLELLGPDVLPVTPADLVAAIEILSRLPHLAVRDALHAATLTHAGMTVVVSADSDFDQIVGLTRLDPSVAAEL